MTQLPKLLAFAPPSSTSAAAAEGALPPLAPGAAAGLPTPSPTADDDPTAASAAMTVASQIQGGLSSFLPPAPLPRQKALNILCVIEAVLLLVQGITGIGIRDYRGLFCHTAHPVYL